MYYMGVRVIYTSRVDEEEIYTYSEIIAGIRKALLDYFRELASKMIEETSRKEEIGITEASRMKVKEYRGEFKRIGVVDGGSSIISLNIGYIGIVASIGIVFEDNRVVKRITEKPVIVPSDPLELPQYENTSIIGSVVDKVREALVFINARRILDEDLDLLIIDGPLIPYGALAKIILRSKSELEAWRMYHDAVLELHRESSRYDTSIIGFVKRPRSKYLASINGWRNFDHVVLSRILSPGEYYPDPPLKLSQRLGLIHDREVAELVEEMKPSTTYIRMNNSTPPYRVDFGYLVHDYKMILSYLYSTRTREGIPYPVMKADEETKITRKLIRELYEDILHAYIVEYIKNDPSLLTPLLPEYGGLV